MKMINSVKLYYIIFVEKTYKLLETIVSFFVKKFFFFEVAVSSISILVVIYLSRVSELIIFGAFGYKLYAITMITFVLLRFVISTLNFSEDKLLVYSIYLVRFLYFVATNGFIWYSFYLVVYGVNTIILDWSNIVLLEKIYWTPEELSLIFNSNAIELNLIDVPEEVKKKIVSSVQNPEDLRKFMVEYNRKLDNDKLLRHKQGVDWFLIGTVVFGYFLIYVIPVILRKYVGT